MNTAQAFGGFTKFVDKNLPQILTGLGIFGLGATVVVTWKNAPKAQEVIKRKKQEMSEVAPDDKETKKQVVKETVKELTPVVAPIVVTAGATAALIFGSNRVSLKREAALTTAFIAADQSLKEWKEASKEVLSKKDVEKVEEKVSENRMQEVMNNGVEPIYTGYGNYLCIDHQTGKKIYTSEQRIDAAFNKLNHKLMNEFGFTPLSWLYGELGAKEANPAWDVLGFNYGDQIDVRYWDSQDPETGYPAREFNYRLSTPENWR